MKATIPKRSISISAGTIYVVENAVSKAARETAYDKLKRMVMSEPVFSEKIPEKMKI